MGLTIFVNGRHVKDRVLARSVANAYGSVLEPGRFPIGVVYLDLPHDLVDVNVHPQKAEVRFADPRAVSDALYAILARSLTTAFSLPTPERAAWGRRAPKPVPLADNGVFSAGSAVAAAAAAAYGLPASAALAGPSGDLDAAPPTLSVPLEPTPFRADESRAFIAFRDSAVAPIQPSPSIRWSMLRFVAQLRHTYLLCEGEEGLYLLDQHAAAERVTFTRLRHEYQSRAVPSQALLFPTVIDVTAQEAEIVEQRVKEIAEVGLDVRLRGPESVSIHAVPRLLQRASAERLLRDLLSEVSRGGGRAFSAAVDLAIATMACHGSVRAGDPLSPSEAKALLTSLDQADFAGHCPHGRPVVTFQSWAELERKVGRR